MRRLFIILGLGLLLGWGGMTMAGISAYEFEDPVKEARFNALADELRCLVCQNQSIAESNADLAKDLRREIYQMISEGKSDQEIIEFMVARYGDFVLYRPPVNSSTVLLWVGPLILFIVGVAVLVVLVRRWGRGEQSGALSEAEQHRLEELLNRGEEGRR